MLLERSKACMLFAVGLIAQLAFTLLFVQHIAA
jgi:hypothetical protein